MRDEPESLVGGSEPANVGERREEYEVENGEAERCARADRNEDDESGHDIEAERECVNCGETRRREPK